MVLLSLWYPHAHDDKSLRTSTSSATCKHGTDLYYEPTVKPTLEFIIFEIYTPIMDFV